MTEMYYNHSDGNTRKLLLAYIYIQDFEKSFRRITTTTAVPVSSRSPTTATTAPATAPVLELSVGSTAARVTLTAAIITRK